MKKTILTLAFMPALLSAGCASLSRPSERRPADAAAQALPQKWVGYEIIGNHHVSRDQVIQAFPLAIGAEYSETPKGWAEACIALQKKFSFVASKCGPLKYLNGDVYMVIDVVERGEESRIRFRTIPDREVEWVAPEIQGHFEALYKRLWALFTEGKAANETADAGYLDYDDPEMHTHVLALAKGVPPFRTRILNVLKDDKNPGKRADAANYLNWTVRNLEDSIAQASRLLDDPSDEVRNNISRFVFHFVDRVTDPGIRRKVIDRFLVQLSRPSHGDRNKAIYCLLDIAKKYPQERGYIRKKGLAEIQYLAEASVLMNVRDPAVEILGLLQDRRSPGPHSGS